MTYTKIKSDFVKTELKKTKWKNRKYIDDLMKIEGVTQGKTYGWTTGYMINGLKSRYAKQWESIWLELNPKKYQKNLEDKKKEAEQIRKENEQFNKEKKLERDIDKKSWIKMGGK